MTVRRACELDHLVVTTPALKVGVVWVESILGVTLQAGGEHHRMGTHNALIRLGHSTYLGFANAGTQPTNVGWRRYYSSDSRRTSSRVRQGGITDALLPPYSIRGSGRLGQYRHASTSATRPCAHLSVGCEQGFPGSLVERIRPAEARDSVEPRVRTDDCVYAIAEASGCMYAIVGAEVWGAE